MIRQRYGQFIVAGALWFTVALAAFASEPLSVLEGTVRTTEGRLVAGATIRLQANDSLVSGVIADSVGAWVLPITGHHLSDLSLVVSAVGFKTRRLSLAHMGDNATHLQLSIILAPLLDSRTTITITESHDIPRSRIDSTEIARRVRAALVPTDATAAVRLPGAARPGSMHSADIRLYGRSPQWRLDGHILEGSTNHYGMFSVVPSPALAAVSVLALGGDASAAEASTIDLETIDGFSTVPDNAVSISTIDASGSMHHRADRWFLSATGRYSVLDRLTALAPASSDRRSLPPTSFRDVLLTSGLRPAPGRTLTATLLVANDGLTVNSVAAAGLGTPTEVDQSTTRVLSAVRYKQPFASGWLTLTGRYQATSEQYRALPDVAGGVTVDLRDATRVVSVGGRWIAGFKNTTVTIGTDVSVRSFDQTGEQNNWNFLSPFSSSDRPHLYQATLNADYGTFDTFGTAVDGAVYLSASRRLAPLDVTAGVRAQQIGFVSNGRALLPRLRIGLPIGAARLELVAGRYRTTPLSSVLNDNQPLARMNLSELKPIAADQVGLRLRYHDVTVETVARREWHRPELVANAVVEALSVQSTGSARLWSAAISWDRERWPLASMAINASYTFTRGSRVYDGVRQSDPESVPHRFWTEVHWQADDTWHFTGQFQLASGQAYAPLTFLAAANEPWNTASYRSWLATDYTQRFRTHAYLTFSAEYRFAIGAAWLTLANVTNRANPIINSPSGRVFDAGILPTVGVRFAI